MARIRQIKPEFCDDHKLGRCSRDARLLFACLWMHADRAGRLRDLPTLLKARIFPYDDDLTPDDVDRFLSELDRESLIIRYKVGVNGYLQIRTFERHQHCHLKEPESQLPPPPTFKPEEPQTQPLPAQNSQLSDFSQPGMECTSIPDKNRSCPVESGVWSNGVLSIENGVMECGETASQPAPAVPASPVLESAEKTPQALDAEVIQVHAHWNSFPVLKRQVRLVDAKKSILEALRGGYRLDQLMLAITRFAKARADPVQFWAPNWSLAKFVTSNVSNFLADTWEKDSERWAKGDTNGNKQQGHALGYTSRGEPQYDPAIPRFKSGNGARGL